MRRAPGAPSCGSLLGPAGPDRDALFFFFFFFFCLDCASVSVSLTVLAQALGGKRS